MRFATLTQIDSRAARHAALRVVGEGEDDGMETAAPSEATRNVVVNVDAIRSFTARRAGPGTRITFMDGGGFSVAEGFDEISQIVNPN